MLEIITIIVLVPVVCIAWMIWTERKRANRHWTGMLWTRHGVKCPMIQTMQSGVTSKSANGWSTRRGQALPSADLIDRWHWPGAVA